MHNVLLEEIALAATVMAQELNWRTGIDALLARLGGAANVSRVYLFEVSHNDRGQLTHGCFHDWASQGLERLASSDRYASEVIENYDPVFESWIDRRRRGELITGHTRDLQGTLREDFDHQRIKSYMSTPIQVDGEWWGHLGFDDCVNERDWSADEIHLLQTTAALIGASAMRDSATRKYNHNEKMRAAMTDVALDAIVVLDGNGITREFNPAAEDLFGRARSDVIGESISALIVPERLRAQHEAGFHAATRNGNLEQPSVRREITALRSDGTEFPAELALAQIDQGHEILYAAFIRDLTDRLTAEQRIRESERERANLARFFSPQLVEHMISIEAPLSVNDYQMATVLFVDMIGFTTFCAENDPPTVLELLRELLALLSEQVFAHEGTIDKFLGDGLMAVFGSPTPGPRDATNAVRCSIAMQQAVSEWNHRPLRLGQAPVRVAVGIHSGNVILGDVGSERRLEFAVLGDTVNIASRVEGKCRSLNCTVLITAAVIAATQKEGGENVTQQFRDFGHQELRGRNGSIHLYGWG